jgi:dienelactone hydrolase
MVARVALVGLLVLAGCGGDPAPSSRATPAPAAGSAPTPAPAPPYRILRFRAADGRRLHGRLTPAARGHAPAVVLVHGLYGGPAQWDDFVAALHRAGFTTLAYASRSADEVDEAVLARDVTGAVRALRGRPEVDADRIVLAGASVGGAAVAYALGRRSRLPVRGGVAFSAVEGRRVAALARRRAFHPRGLLLISDQREARTARRLRADAGGKGVVTDAVESTGHGTALVADATARAHALAWLERLTRRAPVRCEGDGASVNAPPAEGDLHVPPPRWTMQVTPRGPAAATIGRCASRRS